MLMEFVAGLLIILNCSGTGIQSDIYNNGTRDTTTSKITNKKIVLDTDTDSVTIDDDTFASTIADGDLRVNFAPQFGLIRDFKMNIRFSDGHFEWSDSLPLFKDPEKRRRIMNLTGICEVNTVKRKN